MAPDGVVPVGTVLETDVPSRLDRLEWSGWHWRVLLALGVTWVLDGLEAGLIANLGPVLREPGTLALTATRVGEANTAYLLGEVAGALVFGRLADRAGRKRLFLVTLAVYLVGTALSGLATSFAVFAALRFVAGSGIGGEYAAINSAIDELIPARVRGRVDLAVNGSYWLGVALGAVATEVVLDPALVPHAIGWRAAFLLGAVLGLAILLVRRHIPESPRWLLVHGRVAESRRVALGIEAAATGGASLPEPKRVPFRVTGSLSLRHVARVLARTHGRRTVLGLALMIGQTFFYNAIFFTASLILNDFYGVPAEHVGRSMLPFALGNFLGPLLLGRFFDTVGRRALIASTYVGSGVLLVATGWAFREGWLTAATQTASWCAVFFFASAAASSAYLTVSELFPLEVRSLAIAVFYAISTLFGAAAPTIFGALVASGSRETLFRGYVVAAVVMAGAGAVAAWLGVDAEGKSLEELAVAGRG